MLSIAGRIGRLEQAAGVTAGGCALCAAREAQAEAERRREFGPQWERGEAYPSTFDCPQCSKPFVIVFQVIQRRGAARDAGVAYEN